MHKKLHTFFCQQKYFSRPLTQLRLHTSPMGLSLIFVLLLSPPIVAISQDSASNASISAAANNKRSLTPPRSAEELKAEDEIYREYMETISRQLGVTCASCHNVRNWRSDELRNFKVAKEHMRLVQVLIDNGMNGKNGSPKADCFMCHRGVLRPPYQEKIDPLQRRGTSRSLETGRMPANSSQDPTEDPDFNN